MSRFRNLKQRSREVVRGTLNPLSTQLTADRSCATHDSLVVSGFPRSGTTWLAELLLCIPRSGLVFEPMHFRKIPEASAAGISYGTLVPPGTEWPEGKLYFERVLTGKGINRWTGSYMTISQAIGVRRWIIKFVRANQVLAWLIENFSLRSPILLVRHPCAVYSSWAERGWPLMDYPPPAKGAFFKVYPEFSDYVASLRHQDEYFAAIWSMQHYCAFSQLVPGSYQLLSYETLVDDPMGELPNVFARWALDLPDTLERRLSKPSAKASHSLASSSQKQLAGWQKKLERAQIDRMLAVLDHFSLNLYGDDRFPDRTALRNLAESGLT